MGKGSVRETVVVADSPTFTVTLQSGSRPESHDTVLPQLTQTQLQ